MGFAIPVDELRRSVEQIIMFGKVVRPILGISFAPDQSVEQVHLCPEPCPRVCSGFTPLRRTPCAGWVAHLRLPGPHMHFLLGTLLP